MSTQGPVGNFVFKRFRVTKKKERKRENEYRTKGTKGRWIVRGIFPVIFTLICYWGGPWVAYSSVAVQVLCTRTI